MWRGRIGSCGARSHRMTGCRWHGCGFRRGLCYRERGMLGLGRSRSKTLRCRYIRGSWSNRSCRAHEDGLAAQDSEQNGTTMTLLALNGTRSFSWRGMSRTSRCPPRSRSATAKSPEVPTSARLLVPYFLPSLAGTRYPYSTLVPTSSKMSLLPLPCSTASFSTGLLGNASAERHWLGTC